jgi:hypothetical protein
MCNMLCDSEPPINEGFRNFLQNSSISKLGGTKLNILQQNIKVQFLGPISLKKKKLKKIKFFFFYSKKNIKLGGVKLNMLIQR